MLGTEELERYARHIVLREVGGPGQTKLKAARVLVVGAGGLGAPVLLYLAAAGVGTVGVVDDDDVSLSNLQRQIIFATADIGRPKVEASADTVKGLNPLVNVETHHLRLVAANASGGRRDGSRRVAREAHDDEPDGRVPEADDVPRLCHGKERQEHEIDGASMADIARREGVGLNTALARKRYAVLRLREALVDFDERYTPT